MMTFRLAKNLGKTAHKGAAIALALAMIGMQPVHAQDDAVKTQEPAKGEATLNFVGADIESVVKAIGHYTNHTFIVDPRVKGTINLVSEKPVSKSEAFNLLTAALRLQGFAVVTSAGLTKVVPEADAKLQAGPTNVPSLKGDQVATQIYRLNYESAANMVGVLRPLISPNNTINANPGNNTLVVTDYADNLKRIDKIIAALDNPSGSDMDIVPIRYAIASDIATMVNRVLEPSPGDTSRVTLLADARTNSVLIKAPSGARANLAKTLINKLDQPSQLPGNVHVVYLRNADAIKLAQTLRAVVAGESSSSSMSGGSNGQQSGFSNVNNTPTGGMQNSGGGMQAPPPTQGPATLSAGGPGGFIQADAATNTLIITASEPVYRNIRAVIDQLDARRAQVYIESLIVEVTATKAAEFGIQWAGVTGSDYSRYRVGTITGFGGGGSSAAGNNLINQVTSLATTGNPQPVGNGINLGVFRMLNGTPTLGALARALESQDGTNILSMPNLITLDNEEAKIIVGQNVPFITGQFTTPVASTNAAAVNPFQTIERKDIGLTLRVRPQISEGGSVKMAIYQETSNIQSTTSSGIITSKRSIDTNVLVDDGQIIVLGGLIDDNTSDNVEKVPGLGDIPLLGNLFKYQKRNRAKTNLMVFLRPTVVRTNEQSVNLAADRYGYIRNVEVAAQPEPALTLPNVGAPVLPEQHNGQIMDGALLNFRAVKPPQIPAAITPVAPPATEEIK